MALAEVVTGTLRAHSPLVVLVDNCQHRAAVLLEQFCLLHLERNSTVYVFGFADTAVALTGRFPSHFQPRIHYANCFSAAHPGTFYNYSQPDSLFGFFSSEVAVAPQSIIVLDSLTAFVLRHSLFWATRLLETLAAVPSIERVVFSINSDVLSASLVEGIASSCSVRVRLHLVPYIVTISYRKKNGKVCETEEIYR